MNKFTATLLCLGIVISAHARMDRIYKEHMKEDKSEEVRVKNALTDMRIDQNRELEAANHDFQKLHSQIEKAKQEMDSKLALRSLHEIRNEAHQTAQKHNSHIENLYKHQRDLVQKDQHRNEISVSGYKEMMAQLEKNENSDKAVVERELSDTISAINKVQEGITNGVAKRTQSLSHKMHSYQKTETTID